MNETGSFRTHLSDWHCYEYYYYNNVTVEPLAWHLLSKTYKYATAYGETVNIEKLRISFSLAVSLINHSESQCESY